MNRLEQARHKIAQQAEDLTTKAGFTAEEVANLYLEAGLAIALSIWTPEQVASECRARAEQIEALGEVPRYDS